MDQDQVQYLEKILEANLNTIREELRGIRSDISRDRDNTQEKLTDLLLIVNKHETRIGGLEKLWSGLFGRLAFVAALGGMLMATLYEWIKSKFTFLP